MIYNVFILSNLEDKYISSPKEEVKSLISLDTSNYKYVDCCSETNNCPLGKMEYPKLSIQSNKKSIRNLVNQINSKVDDYYQRCVKSETGDAECQAIYGDVLHSIAPVALYEDSSLIGISFRGYNLNLCTQISSDFDFMTYIYDVKKDKFIDQEEFMTTYSIQNDEVLSAISENLVQMNASLETQYTYTGDSGYQLFIASDGTINAYYLVDNDSNLLLHL